MLTNEQLLEFQTLFHKRFGREIDQEEARDMGAKLIRLFMLTYRPMTEADYRELEKRRKERPLDSA